MVFPNHTSTHKIGARRLNSSDPVSAAVANKLKLWDRAQTALSQKSSADEGTMRRRLEAELVATNDPELIEGFLAAADLVAELRRNGIALGPGNVADPGSLICWLLGITEINPLDYGLLHECFASSYPHTFFFDVAMDQLAETFTIAMKLLKPLPVDEDEACSIAICGQVVISRLKAMLDHLGSRGTKIELEKLALDDISTYELLSRDDTDGVRSYEKYVDGRLWGKAKPRSLWDLAFIIRPCSFDPEKCPTDIETRFLSPFTHESRGTLEYQEQAVKAIAYLAGWSLSRAVSAWNRRDTGDTPMIGELRREFTEASGALGSLLSNEAESVFDFIMERDPPIMLQSHCVSMALVAYRCAWLKAHHPDEFKRFFLESRMVYSDGEGYKLVFSTAGR